MMGLTSLYRSGDADFTYEDMNLTVSAEMALLALKVCKFYKTADFA